jgi:methionyl-tRNA formyltransferase
MTAQSSTSAGLATVFMGTPEFAVPSLRALASETELRLVITQPDRPVGRGRKPASPPVKLAAEEIGAAVEQPERTKGRRFAERIGELEPDLIVTAAFGRMLGRRLLSVPRFGCLNVHASLLPRYRGAAPINRAILDGAERTGVSIAKMVQSLDAGPVYLRESVEIGPEETAGELAERLSRVGAEALLRVLREIGGIEPEPQEPDLVSWAPQLRKAEGRVDWSLAAGRVHDHVRGMHPWPCAFTELDERRLRIHRCEVLEADGRHAERPGEVIAHGSAGLDVACGRGAVRLLELQLPGRKRLDSARFHAGCRLEPGTLLGSRARD